jgi:ABC-2 type transport system permease protein
MEGRCSDLPLPLSHLAGISPGVALLGLDFGLLTIAAGARTGSRGTALGVAAPVGAASYLLSSLAPAVA